MHRRILSAAATLFAAAVLAPAFAQESRATLSGHVVDPSGAVVPSVKLTALNLQTGVAAATQSTESGVYTIPFLLPGSYRLTAEKEGFKTYPRDNLQLR